MQLYGLKTCDTCRKARKALSEKNVSFEFIDVRGDGLPTAVIDEAIVRFPDKVINKASTTWRGLSDAEKARAPAALLQAHPTLLKRPLIVGDDWTIGWDKAAQETWL